eukprot:gene10798-12593_t
MDGTLTEPHAIDFKAMYTRNGLIRKPGDDILTLIMQLPEPRRSDALKVIHEEEMLGCERMKMRPSMHNFLHAASKSNIQLALSTRNCDTAYQHFLKLASLPDNYFSPALHRDSLGTINKPDPQVAKHILKAWEIPEGEEHTVWFVGDSVDDMACGKLAGCRTALITTGTNNDVVLQSPELVDVVVDHFDELLTYFKLHQDR